MLFFHWTLNIIERPKPVFYESKATAWMKVCRRDIFLQNGWVIQTRLKSHSPRTGLIIFAITKPFRKNARKNHKTLIFINLKLTVQSWTAMWGLQIGYSSRGMWKQREQIVKQTCILHFSKLTSSHKMINVSSCIFQVDSFIYYYLTWGWLHLVLRSVVNPWK